VSADLSSFYCGCLLGNCFDYNLNGKNINYTTDSSIIVCIISRSLLLVLVTLCHWKKDDRKFDEIDDAENADVTHACKDIW